MKNALLFICLVSLSLLSQAQNNSLLWEVSGNGLTKSSYLFGTYHSKDSRAHQFGDSVLIKLSEADLGVFEFIEDLEKDKSALMKRVLMKDKTLEDLISKKDFKFVKSQVMEKLGFAGLFFNNMKPIFTSTFANEMMARNEMPLTVDNFLKEEFNKTDKKTIGLETIDEAMASMDNIPLKEQAKMLVEYFREYDSQSIMGDTMLAMYQRKDLFAMQYFHENSDDIPSSFDQSLVVERNNKFVNGLLPYLKEQSVFCAVGALHLPGKTGLIESLRAKGYTVTPVFSQHTPTQLTIKREHDWGYFDNDSLNMIMHFPEDPYYQNTTFSNQDSSKTINLVHYFFKDTLNDITYSIEAGKIEPNTWSIKELINTLVTTDNLQIINQKKEMFYETETTIVEFYVSPGISRKCHFVKRNNILYIKTVEGSKQKIYADLSEYFFSGMSFESLKEFQDLLDNQHNLTVDLYGAVLFENKDSVGTYDIFIVNAGDTTVLKFENENTFYISLNLGYKYIFGVKKEGYFQKHLIVNTIEQGTIQDAKFGFDFPMNFVLQKGDANAPSTHVATVKYNPFKGYMDHR